MTKITLEANPTLIFFLSLATYLAAVFFINPHLNHFILFLDYGDILYPGGYYEQSIWVDTPLIPYKDYFVEYPPAGLYLYSLPRIFFNIYSPQDFFNAFLFMALFPIAGIYFLLAKKVPQAVLFLCTPSFFYYSLARYDVFPAFFSLWAIILIINNRPLWGAVILGLAVGIKWYAVVLILPILAMVDQRFKWLIIVSISTLFFTLHNVIYAGVDGLLSSYNFHTGRVFNRESIYYLLHKYWWPDSMLPWTKQIFLALQLLPSFVIAALFYFKKVPLNRENIAIASIITILCFILFAKFHSPQWLVWLIPFVILLADKRILWAYIALDITNYITVPLAIRILADVSAEFDFVNFIRACVSIMLLILCLIKLQEVLRNRTTGESASIFPSKN